jgi:hypothetical protein
MAAGSDSVAGSLAACTPPHATRAREPGIAAATDGLIVDAGLAFCKVSRFDVDEAEDQGRKRMLRS